MHMTALWIIVCVIILFSLLLLVRVKIQYSYAEKGLFIDVKYLGFTYQIYPEEAKKEEKKENVKEKKRKRHGRGKKKTQRFAI